MVEDGALTAASESSTHGLRRRKGVFKAGNRRCERIEANVARPHGRGARETTLAFTTILKLAFFLPWSLGWC